jgi:hypothetical protein
MILLGRFPALRLVADLQQSKAKRKNARGRRTARNVAALAAVVLVVLLPAQLLALKVPSAVLGSGVFIADIISQKLTRCTYLHDCRKVKTPTTQKTSSPAE